MSSSYLRLTKSETRELADREYRARRFGQVEEWRSAHSIAFSVFVALAAVLAVLALLLR